MTGIQRMEIVTHKTICLWLHDTQWAPTHRLASSWKLLPISEQPLWYNFHGYLRILCQCLSMVRRRSRGAGEKGEPQSLRRSAMWEVKGLRVNRRPDLQPFFARACPIPWFRLTRLTRLFRFCAFWNVDRHAAGKRCRDRAAFYLCLYLSLLYPATIFAKPSTLCERRIEGRHRESVHSMLAQEKKKDLPTHHCCHPRTNVKSWWEGLGIEGIHGAMD